MLPTTFDRLTRSLARASRRTLVRAALGAVAGVLSVPRQPARGQDAIGCTLVELRPGYPGYRGFVTGLYGAGEAACLEELATLYPWFDPATEDAANAAAAASLGLTGDPSVWVWEHWLAIEAARGLLPACYLAAYQQMPAGGFASLPAADDDPRLLVGNIGSQEFVWRVAGALGVTPGAISASFPDDYLLRAVGWAYSGLAYPTAWDILAGAEAAMSSLSAPGADAPYIVGRVRLQGGYAPVPPSACPDDQLFLALTTIATVRLVNSGPVGKAFLNEVEFAATSWRGQVARGAQISLRDYLIANVPGLP